MKYLHHIINSLLCIAITLMTVGCESDNGSELHLDGDTWITSLSLDGYEGVIDNAGKTITVGIPQTYNAEAMKVTAITASPKATVSVLAGDVLNMNYPQQIRVANGDVYLDYTLTVKHDEARITAFSIGSYTGVINEESHTITVIVPTEMNVTNLVPTIALTAGATVTPAADAAQDFSKPVQYTVTYGTATSVYTVTVKQVSAPEAVFVGEAATQSELKPEELEAFNWMMGQVPGTFYVSFKDMERGAVDLSECKVVWWHFHWDSGIDTMDKFKSAAPTSLNALGKMKELNENGVGMLFTRYATYYPTVMGVSKETSGPNNCWGNAEDNPETTSSPWNFFIQGHTDHPLYQNLVAGIDANSVYTCDAGYRITNTTAQWHIGSDWGNYPSIEVWRTKTGAVDLGYGGDGAVVVWEFPTDGNRGGILCIGSGCYDWYAKDYDASKDKYHSNMGRITQNALNYLMKK